MAARGARGSSRCVGAWQCASAETSVGRQLRFYAVLLREAAHRTGRPGPNHSAATRIADQPGSGPDRAAPAGSTSLTSASTLNLGDSQLWYEVTKYGSLRGSLRGVHFI